MKQTGGETAVCNQTSMHNKLTGTSPWFRAVAGILRSIKWLIAAAASDAAFIPLIRHIGGAFLCFERVEKMLHMLGAANAKEDPAAEVSSVWKRRTKGRFDTDYLYYLAVGIMARNAVAS